MKPPKPTGQKLDMVSQDGSQSVKPLSDIVEIYVITTISMEIVVAIDVVELYIILREASLITIRSLSKNFN